jgi:hypothetical protein
MNTKILAQGNCKNTWVDASELQSKLYFEALEKSKTMKFKLIQTKKIKDENGDNCFVIAPPTTSDPNHSVYYFVKIDDKNNVKEKRMLSILPFHEGVLNEKDNTKLCLYDYTREQILG